MPERGNVALPLADMAREEPESYAWPGGCTRNATAEDLPLAAELFTAINGANEAAIQRS